MTTTQAGNTAYRVASPRRGTDLPALRWQPLAVVLLADGALLGGTVNNYGYDRDELYFRILAAHPGWGYVDQPPLTPLLARAGIALFGDTLWGIRVPALVCALVTVWLTVVLTRELGGGGAAQTLAAIGVSSTFLFIAGHVLLTATPDMVVWLLVILFATRSLRRGQPRWWLAVGLSVGLGLYNKQLVALLLVGLAGGLLIAGPRRELANRWLWGGAAIALLIGAPNLIYQILNGWPEVTMAGVISSHKGADDRALFVPFQLILLGLTAVPIWAAGLLHLFRDPGWRPLRGLAWAYPLIALIVLATGGQPYYTFGLLTFLYSAGCVVTARWAAGHLGRWVWTGAAVATGSAFAVLVALPLIPVNALPTAVATINQTARDSIGWPAYVGQIATVYRSLPAAEQTHTVVITQNYGEAGAVDRFGPAMGLPHVFSGQNQLFLLGRPPQDTTTVIAVGLDDPDRQFHTCTRSGSLDNQVGVANEEQGRPITICRGPILAWTQLWPTFQHYD